MKFIYLAITISLISACATTKYLGTEQPSLAAHACSIETKQCFMSTTAVERSGSDTSINGSWFLDDLGSGSYYLHGSVKLSISKVSASKIEFLDLTFVFFKGDLVVHEEKIRVRGDFGKYHEFSRIIKSEVVVESSAWAWFNWRGH